MNFASIRRAVVVLATTALTLGLLTPTLALEPGEEPSVEIFVSPEAPAYNDEVNLSAVMTNIVDGENGIACSIQLLSPAGGSDWFDSFSDGSCPSTQFTANEIGTYQINISINGYDLDGTEIFIVQDSSFEVAAPPVVDPTVTIYSPTNDLENLAFGDFVWVGATPADFYEGPEGEPIRCTITVILDANTIDEQTITSSEAYGGTCPEVNFTLDQAGIYTVYATVYGYNNIGESVIVYPEYSFEIVENEYNTVITPTIVSQDDDSAVIRFTTEWFINGEQVESPWFTFGGTIVNLPGLAAGLGTATQVGSTVEQSEADAEGNFEITWSGLGDHYLSSTWDISCDALAAGDATFRVAESGVGNHVTGSLAMPICAPGPDDDGDDDGDGGPDPSPDPSPSPDPVICNCAMAAPESVSSNALVGFGLIALLLSVTIAWRRSLLRS